MRENEESGALVFVEYAVVRGMSGNVVARCLGDGEIPTRRGEVQCQPQSVMLFPNPSKSDF